MHIIPAQRPTPRTIIQSAHPAGHGERVSLHDIDGDLCLDVEGVRGAWFLDLPAELALLSVLERRSFERITEATENPFD